MNLDDLDNELDGLDIGLDIKEYPIMVKGRVAHIDADFLAYMASYERTDEDVGLVEILYRTDVMVMDKMREAAAETAVLHLTPRESNKGGRYDVAIQKKYQGQRAGDKPRHLEACRQYMGSKRGPVKGVLWDNAEADDGMAEAGWQAYHAGTTDQCVIVTKDKDLRMVPTLHLNWDTGTIREIYNDVQERSGAFGWIGIKERVSKDGRIVKKHDGFGTKFFWFQLLMGDIADNIKGCPKAVIHGKHKACGLVGAYSLLEHATSDYECLKICMEAFKSNSYTHWETGEVATWRDVMWSEAQMLWMQRTPGNINDVKEWMKEIINV